MQATENECKCKQMEANRTPSVHRAGTSLQLTTTTRLQLAATPKQAANYWAVVPHWRWGATWFSLQTLAILFPLWGKPSLGSERRLGFGKVIEVDVLVFVLVDLHLFA